MLRSTLVVLFPVALRWIPGSPLGCLALIALAGLALLGSVTPSLALFARRGLPVPEAPPLAGLTLRDPTLLLNVLVLVLVLLSVVVLMAL